MPLSSSILILAFTLSGVNLKLADLYDQKRRGYVFASIAAISMGLLTSDSPSSSSIILGIIVGVALAGKIDQPNLLVGLSLTLTTAIVIGLSTGFIIPDLPLLALVTATALIDEIGHDKTWGTILPSFFRFRMTLKTTMILLTTLTQIDILHIVDINHAVGFFCFDLSYDVITAIADSNKRGAIQ